MTRFMAKIIPNKVAKNLTDELKNNVHARNGGDTVDQQLLDATIQQSNITDSS